MLFGVGCPIGSKVNIIFINAHMHIDTYACMPPAGSGEQPGLRSQQVLGPGPDPHTCMAAQVLGTAGWWHVGMSVHMHMQSSQCLQCLVVQRIIKQMSPTKCVCLLGKRFPHTAGVFYILLAPPSCHICDS